jgi:hypothetical protein
MILAGNLPAIFERASRSARVLDVGGWWRPFHLATHVLDVMPFETRREDDAIDPQHPARFAATTWIVQDACRPPWPFPDKFFDFSFCSHTLEDVRDPIAVCGELVRVARSGYIETPSRVREIFSKARFFAVRAALGHMPAIGFDHHRWFVELEGTHLRFTAKDLRLVAARRNFITRRDLGRKLSERESGIALFWEDAFTFEEVFTGEGDLRGYRDAALARLRRR